MFGLLDRSSKSQNFKLVLIIAWSTQMFCYNPEVNVSIIIAVFNINSHLNINWCVRKWRSRRFRLSKSSKSWTLKDCLISQLKKNRKMKLNFKLNWYTFQHWIRVSHSNIKQVNFNRLFTELINLIQNEESRKLTSLLLDLNIQNYYGMLSEH